MNSYPLYCTVYEDRDTLLYLLWIGSVLSTSVLVQRSLRSSYISVVDSTGLGRGFSKLFILFVLRNTPGFVLVFSRPKAEFIFGKSAQNQSKRVLNGYELFSLWKSIVQIRCSKQKPLENKDKLIKANDSLLFSNENTCFNCTWSNFLSERVYPHKSLFEIDLFVDEPISKSIGVFQHINDLFEGLLVKNDFVNGGLLFSQCSCGPVTSRSIPHEEKYKVSDIIERLRSLDFSCTESATISSNTIMKEFNTEKISINFTNDFIKEPKIENIKRIIPRKK